ncbi:MAG: glycoside hydrolase family 99-like domain-containing protein [Sedimentisphaerales bacterium]|nr:glycoside hydrolase family 99-like domain-containing protein [Sedimentisphaerales bacterium]
MKTSSWITLTLVALVVLPAGANLEPLLSIEPGPANPRNSEGDLIELKDGGLCLIYSRFTGGSGDDAAADLAVRISQDEGRTWSQDKIVVPRKDGLNVMSVSLRRLPGGCIAISEDEGKTWSRSTAIEDNPDGWYCYTAITFVKDRVPLAYCAGDRTIGGLNRLKVAAFARDRLASGDTPDLPCAWEFDTEQDLKVWRPNAHLADVTTANGVVRARAVDSDPFLLCRDVTINATPHQYIVSRVRASRAGVAELFWSGQLQGQYGGLTEARKLRFSVQGESRWQEIVLFPFWHTEGTIRQLRLDLYEGADFEIDWIRVGQWGRGVVESSAGSWTFDGDLSKWQVHPAAAELFAPPMELDASDKKWIGVELASDREAMAGILWANKDVPGLQSEEFPIRGDGESHVYNLRMHDTRTWNGRICAFGIRLPQAAKTQLERIQISDEPVGPGELEVGYLGFENGVNRAGRPCKVLAQIIGNGPARSLPEVSLQTFGGPRVISKPKEPGHSAMEHGQTVSFVWEVVADSPGNYPVELFFDGKPVRNSGARLEFTEAPAIPRADYVPVPKPVKTDIEVCAFYFPGWESDAKWDCIRKIAPIRKPLLGYYDESNPECVDWQIKWAVENGISCFLVDWYWVQGRQQLTHWFDAYRKAKYRDMLKVAIMWANHNPPGTHSTDDWLKVAAHWIDAYFSLPGYYHINGKPAVFLWDPKGLRTDLGGSEAVRKAIEKSQEMAKAAGFNGITLIALGYDFSQGHIHTLKEEGYSGVTTYHEWGSTIDGQVSQKLFRFEDVVRDSPDAWKRRNEAADGLIYYPLVDTGWDSRPWHGHKAMMVRGRTIGLFVELLCRARSFCEENNKRMVILGPVNEWGEGSYIEPCTEFGFGMLEAVRDIFATGPSSEWPVNIAPSDVGLRPYDFPPQREMNER